MNNILLINPWIYDFAAYDLWIKPWGLLKISSILKENGLETYLIDVLDRFHPIIEEKGKRRLNGTGKFIAEEIKKPEIFKSVPRTYRRYGLPLDKFEKALPAEAPDAVLISSGMTYWYPGAFKAIEIVKDKYNGVPIILGGTYATLAYEHAFKKSGADHIVTNNELNKISSILGREIDLSFQHILDAPVDYSFYEDPDYAVIRTSLGCPFNCAYCAQKHLGPDFLLKDLDKAVEEIRMLYERGIRNFAFYDDALLFDNGYIKKYMRRVLKEGIKGRFYTPNGLHARFLDQETAELMKQMNLVDPILSLETADNEKGSTWHKKVTKEELREAISNLKKAGYSPGEYTVYLMLGVPGSVLSDVEDSIDFIHSLGARISLSEFSPVPGTEMARDFKSIIEEPLATNNSVFPSFDLSEWESVSAVKKRARDLNEILRMGE